MNLFFRKMGASWVRRSRIWARAFSSCLSLGLPPREILERHQDCFADVPAIYGAKRNMLNRLGRSRDLRQLYRDLRAA